MADRPAATPLGHRRPIPAGEASLVAIEEIAGRAMIDLRIAPGEEQARNAAFSVLGFGLPSTPRSSSMEGDRAALWLSIDQWLIVDAPPRRQALFDGLSAALGGHFAAVTDLSDARAVVRLCGEGAGLILMKGLDPDLSQADARAGSVRRAAFAGVDAIVHIARSAPETIDIFVDRSVADHAWSWLVRAAQPGAAFTLFSRQEPPPV
jgi:sarcosine oxidase subunit gamma